MRSSPKVGTEFERVLLVEPRHCIDFEGLAVLSTPTLVGELELAALELLKPLLDADEITVGVQIELEHRAPAVAGQQIVCRAKVVHREGRLVTLAITAVSGGECLASGVHKRRAVSKSRLAARLKRHQKSSTGESSAS